MSRTVCEHFVEECEPCEECDKAGGELAALMEDAAAIILKMKDTLAVRGARPTTEKEAALWDECFAVYVRMVKWATNRSEEWDFTKTAHGSRTLQR